ncbi:MAG TPA: glycosyltransferase family 39 protein [Myxococcota bacterium]|nr:glycosyltransferase family 39 protein [Myxococcota bacterium]
MGLAGDRARRLAPLLVLLAAAAALLFTDLGGPWLWEDEADTALFARAIVRDGLPTAWDGRSFVDSDDGMRVAPHALGHDFVLVGTPWLPYYVAAASFALFGESEWAARLPFALVALATVAALYGLVLRTTGSARAAFAAGLLLLASAQFLLFGREARSYAPNMLLTVVLLAGFLRLGERRRDPWLAVAAVLLFYVQVLPVAVALAACAGLALLHPAFRPRLPALLARAPFVAALTLAWLLLAWSGTRVNWEPLGSAAEWPRRIGQLAAEASVAVPALGWAIGLPLVRRRLGPGDRTLLALCAAWLVACAALAPLALSASLLEVVGLRYVCGMLPVAAAVSGVLVARASGRSAAAYAAVLALFAATQLAGSALPWLALGHSRRLAGVAVSVPRDLGAKLFNVPWWAFVRGLGAPDAGTLHPLVGLLRERAARDDVVLTNFGWDGLYYYSDLGLGMRIDPSAPVYAHARRRELPRYVFDVDDADWIVWRGGNEAFLGYPFLLLGQPLEALRARLAARGARLELVAELPETLWENRPELFWHRFPGLGHPFAPPRLGARGPRYRDARVFRVSWPAEAARTAAPTALPGAPPATTDAAPPG